MKVYYCYNYLLEMNRKLIYSVVLHFAGIKKTVLHVLLEVLRYLLLLLLFRFFLV